MSNGKVLLQSNEGKTTMTNNITKLAKELRNTGHITIHGTEYEVKVKHMPYWDVSNFEVGIRNLIDRGKFVRYDNKWAIAGSEIVAEDFETEQDVWEFLNALTNFVDFS